MMVVMMMTMLVVVVMMLRMMLVVVQVDPCAAVQCSSQLLRPQRSQSGHGRDDVRV